MKRECCAGVDEHDENCPWAHQHKALKETNHLLLWALENTEKEPMCEDPEVQGHCDFKFEIGGRDLCPCEWKVILRSEVETSKET
jgi:hypothetical protein